MIHMGQFYGHGTHPSKQYSVSGRIQTHTLTGNNTDRHTDRQQLTRHSSDG